MYGWVRINSKHRSILQTCWGGGGVQIPPPQTYKVLTSLQFKYDSQRVMLNDAHGH
jgi:hypothetical protein